MQDEAASIDGANPVNRFRHVTVPLLMPVLTIVLLFSIIQTFADFQIVQVLTRGGPADSTHLFATLANRFKQVAPDEITIFQNGAVQVRTGPGTVVWLHLDDAVGDSLPPDKR